MLKDHMPPPGADVQILMCGPPPMINFACVPNLEKLGYTKDMYFAFWKTAHIANVCYCSAVDFLKPDL